MKTLSFDDIRSMKGNGSSMRMVLKFFIEKGANVELLYESTTTPPERYYMVHYDGLQIPLRAKSLNFYSVFNSLFAQTITTDKLKTRHILDAFDLNNPETILATNQNSNLKFLNDHKQLVVKPLDGSHGEGITTNIVTEADLNQAIGRAKSVHSEVLLQQQVAGDDHRLLFIDYKFAAAVKRSPARIEGDGSSTVRELVEANNQRIAKLYIEMRSGDVDDQQIRGSVSKTPIEEIVAARGEKFLDTIPKKGESVQLVHKANVSLGGQTEDVTTKVNSQLTDQIEKLLRSIDLPLCGIDVLSEDISSSPETKKSYIIELNAAPGLRLHELPTHGEMRTVTVDVANLLIQHYKAIAKNSKK